ncbi:uncharacterized protein LOC134287840 [Aedes albopictus]|uniref:DUF4806 domain-containing protein n=1 Tax=Aedes albopictus TaxID=7160 RepID=A0ABM1YDD0_AEDAL
MMIEICSDETTRHASDDDQSKATVSTGGNTATRSLRLAGFTFPLKRAEDIERLEKAVRADSFVRKEYIRYVSSRVADHRNIPTHIRRVFSDRSLENYAYHGVSNPQYPRKAMKDYDIFTKCLLVAWEEDGITADELRASLIKATQKAKQHLSSARYYQRYREQLLEKRKASWKSKKLLE